MRPRLLLALRSSCCRLSAGAIAEPARKSSSRAYKAVQAAAGQHWGHVATPGCVYKLLDDRLYPDRGGDRRLGVRRGAAVPRPRGGTVRDGASPWEAQSAAALAYLPEQIVWYVLVVLLRSGLVFALRRDALVAGLLFGHAMVAALTVALTSGNVGTLVRHRGLALPTSSG